MRKPTAVSETANDGTTYDFGQSPFATSPSVGVHNDERPHPMRVGRGRCCVQ
jgi:hypothetical protein